MSSDRMALPQFLRPKPTAAGGPAADAVWLAVGDEVDGIAAQSLFQAIVSIAAAAIAATFITALQHGLGLAWLLSVVALEGARLGVAGWYRRSPAQFDYVHWKLSFLFLAAASGIIWGGFVALEIGIHQKWNDPALVLPWLAVVISTISLGKVSSRAAIGSLIFLLLLPAMAHFFSHEHMNPVLGGAMALCVGGAFWLVFRLESFQRELAKSKRQIIELETASKAQAYHHGREHGRYIAILNGIGAAVVVTDQNLVVEYWNTAFAALYSSFKTLDPALDRVALGDVLAPYADPADEAQAARHASWQKLTQDLRPKSGKTEVRYNFTDQSGRAISVAGHRLPDNGWVFTFEDASGERQAATNALLEATRHDPLTGLPNRASFRRALERALNRARLDNKTLAVAILNIGAFKNINDTLGSRVGDEVLRHAAACLTAAKSEHGIVGRIGSDEFGIIFEGVAATDAVVAKAKSILKAIKAPVHALPGDIPLDSYIGVTLFPYDHGNAEDLIRNAGIALDRARQDQPDAIVVFDHSMDAEVRARAALTEDIRRNLHSKSFVFHYQPQVDLRTKEVVGAEALLRWNHPERGWQSPDSFIPTAEFSRLIIPLTERMIPEACEQIKAWDDRGLPPLKIAINLSPIHLMKTDLPALVEKELNRTGVGPERMEFEITESAVIGEHEDARTTIARLREIGVSLAIDDFGTGYASIGYLRRIPVGKIKIDRGFTREVEHDPGARSIIGAIAGLGHSFRLDVVAEGIENEDHERLVADLGCNIGQGYHYARPLNGEMFAAWVANRREMWPMRQARRTRA